MAALAATSIAANAASAPKKHTHRYTYSYGAGPAVATPSPGPTVNSCAPYAWCYTVQLKPSEHYLSVAAKDATGLPAYIQIYPSRGAGVHGSNKRFLVCGAARDLKVPAGSAWELSPTTLSASTACPGVATAGTIGITTSNLR